MFSIFDFFNFHFNSRGVRYEERDERIYIGILIKFDKSLNKMGSVQYVTTFSKSDEEAENKFKDFQIEDEDWSYSVTNIHRLSDLIDQTKVVWEI